MDGNGFMILDLKKLGYLCRLWGFSDLRIRKNNPYDLLRNIYISYRLCVYNVIMFWGGHSRYNKAVTQMKGGDVSVLRGETETLLIISWGGV